MLFKMPSATILDDKTPEVSAIIRVSSGLMISDRIEF